MRDPADLARELRVQAKVAGRWARDLLLEAADVLDECAGIDSPAVVAARPEWPRRPPESESEPFDASRGRCIPGTNWIRPPESESIPFKETK